MMRLAPGTRMRVAILTLTVSSLCAAQPPQMGGPPDVQRSTPADEQINARIEQQIEGQIERQIRNQIRSQVEQQTSTQMTRRMEDQIKAQVLNQAQQNATGKTGLTQGDQNAPAMIGQASSLSQTANTSSGESGQALGTSEQNGADQAPGFAQDISANAQERRSGAATQTDATATRAEEKRHPSYNVVRDARGFDRINHQWLTLVDEAQLPAMAKADQKASRISRLHGLGLVLVETAEPPSATKSLLPTGVDIKAGDFNHLYRYQVDKAGIGPDEGWAPSEAFPFTRTAPAKPIKIGLIDSALNGVHPAFGRSRITQQSFLENGLSAPFDHGTAVGSILVGGDEGLLPDADLYAAGVFYTMPELGAVASVKSILLALDWMLASNVQVVNLSLAGPDNSLLGYALHQATKQGMTIVAAAGNGGPAAPPAFPAAYENVIAATAIDRNRQIYFRANRGSYIDVAAPGVAIRHAIPGGRYGQSSGTSYATPFVTAAVAHVLSMNPGKDALQQLLIVTEDLGQPGFDATFGHGMIVLP